MPKRGRLVPSRVVALIVLVVLVAAGAIACSSGTSASDNAPEAEVSRDPSREPSNGSGPVGTTVGPVVTADAVRCALAPRSEFGAVIGVAGAPEVPCSATHNHESFALPDSIDLDDCYRAAAASSDLRLGTSSFGDGALDFDDDRLVGHVFGTAAGPGIECSIDLRDDRDGALIGR